MTMLCGPYPTSEVVMFSYLWNRVLCRDPKTPSTCMAMDSDQVGVTAKRTWGRLDTVLYAIVWAWTRLGESQCTQCLVGKRL